MIPLGRLHPDRDRRQPFHLSEAEYEYVQTGEGTGSYADRPDKLDGRVREKIKDLPSRLELLFDDIEELDRPSERDPPLSPEDDWGFLTSDIWGSGWRRVFDIPPRDNIDRELQREDVQAERFGRRLGRLSQALLLYPQHVPAEDLWIDMISGFVDGLCLAWELETPREKRAFVDRLVEHFDGPVRDSIDRLKEEQWDWWEGNMDRKEAMGNAVQRVAEILQTAGIEQERQMARHIVERIMEREGVEYHDIGRKFARRIDEAAVLDVVSDEQLKEKQSLLSNIHGDVEDLLDKGSRGPEPVDILKAVSAQNSPSSREIAEYCTRKQHTAGVTETARDLAGQRDPGKRPGRVWTDRSLLRGGRNQWELTDYGTLIAGWFNGSGSGLVWGFTDSDLEKLPTE